MPNTDIVLQLTIITQMSTKRYNKAVQKISTLITIPQLMFSPHTALSARCPR